MQCLVSRPVRRMRTIAEWYELVYCACTKRSLKCKWETASLEYFLTFLNKYENYLYLVWKYQKLTNVSNSF